MKRAALATIFLISVMTASAWGQGQMAMPLPEKKQDGKFSAEWRLRLAGSDQRDEQSQSKVVDVRTEIKTKYLLTNSLWLDIQPSFRLQSGQNQSVDGADKPESKISLNQAAAIYTPVRFLRLAAGALNQRSMHTDLFVDNIAFPAARLEGILNEGRFKTGLSLESAIPTSTSLSTDTKELEPTPSLNTAALKFQWQAANNLYWKTSAGYFTYNNLPSAVAQKSGLLGNEVDQLSEAQYAFKYNYQGLELSTEVEFPILSVLDISLGAEYLKNEKALSNNNSAYRYFISGEIHLSKGLDLTLGGSYFQVEPEATVSYFNSVGFETNRVGYSAESSIAFNKEGFLIGLKYTDSEVLYANPVQSREKMLFLKLETFYAGI